MPKEGGPTMPEPATQSQIQEFVDYCFKQPFQDEQHCRNTIRSSPLFKFRDVDDLPSLAAEETQQFLTNTIIGNNIKVVKILYKVDPASKLAYLEKIIFEPRTSQKLPS